MYSLRCLDPDDSFSFSNPDFDIPDLKKMACDREKEPIFWDEFAGHDSEFYAVNSEGYQVYEIVLCSKSH